MNNKKGISALIETVLLILVVIAAVGIVAGLLMPMIRTAAERTATCQGLIDITSASSAGVTYIQSKAGNVSSMTVNFYNSAGAAIDSTNDAATTAVGNSVTANPSTGGTYVKVTVVPVITTASGKQVACPTIESAI